MKNLLSIHDNEGESGEVRKEFKTSKVKMRSRIISFAIIFALIISLGSFSMYSNTDEASAATTPPKVSVDTVNKRISQLQTLNGNYFTVNNKPCGLNVSQHGCNNCNVTNVLSKNKTIRNLIYKYKGGYNVASYSYLPVHYYNGSTCSLGQSCLGFANFAEWYIFSSKTSDQVKTKIVKSNVVYNYSNMKNYIKPGDVLRFAEGHSAVAISVEKSGVKVINANLNRSGVKISTDILYYDSWSRVGISRAENYSMNSVLSVKVTNVESTGKPKITWTPQYGATKYMVYSKNGNKPYKFLGSTTGNSLVNTSAIPTYYYTYKVQALNSSGKVLKTDYEDRTCDLAQPTMTSITNVSSTGAIKGYFKGVKYANRYQVYRATSKNGTYSYVFSVDTKMCAGGESLSFTNPSTTPGKTYYYKIRAVNTNYRGADSALSSYMYRTRDLARPVVKVSGDSYGRNVVSYDAVKGADRYEIYRATNGIDFTRIYSGTSRSVTNTKNITPGTTYYYKVRAIDNDNSYANSAYSTVVNRKYTSQIKVTANNVASTGKPKITWTPQYGATKYMVYSKNGNNSYKLLGSTTGSSFVDTSAIPTYYYTYKVQALNSSGKVLKTDYEDRTCDLAQPTMTSITNVSSTGAIKGYFKGVKYANRYQVYRATSKNGTYSYVFSVDTKMCAGGESLSFTNPSTTPGKTYYYKIRAVNTNYRGADSALSSYMYRTRDLARPVVKVSGDSYGRNVVSYDAVKGADRYEIYRSTNGIDFTRIYSGTSRSVTNTKNITPGTIYYYKVKAIDNDNSYANSDYSTIVSREYNY